MLDLDDTLFLERDYVLSGFTAVGEWVRRKFQMDDFAARAMAHFETGRRGDIFDAVFRDCHQSASQADIRLMIDLYRRHTPSIAPLPDASAFLSLWRGKCAMALISDGPVLSQRRKLSALGVREYFEPVVFTGVWARRYAKPHQRAFLLVQSHFANRDLRFVYVADNPEKDFHAPLSLGWDTVRVRRTDGIHSARQALKGVEPRYEVSDLNELSSILMSYSTY